MKFEESIKLFLLMNVEIYQQLHLKIRLRSNIIFRFDLVLFRDRIRIRFMDCYPSTLLHAERNESLHKKTIKMLGRKQRRRSASR